MLHAIPKEIVGPRLVWIGPTYPCASARHTGIHAIRGRIEPRGHHNCVETLLQTVFHPPDNMVVWCSCPCTQEGDRHYYNTIDGTSTCPYCRNSRHPRLGEYAFT